MKSKTNYGDTTGCALFAVMIGVSSIVSVWGLVHWL